MGKYMFLMRLVCISACEAPSFRSCCDGRPDHQFCILSTSAAASVQLSDGLDESCALQSSFLSRTNFPCFLSACKQVAFFCRGLFSRVGAVLSLLLFSSGMCHECIDCMVDFSLFSEAHAVTLNDRTAFTQGPLSWRTA